MRVFDELFSFTCEESENRTVAISGLLASNSGVDHIFAETTKGMVFKVCSGGLILRVLKTSDAASAQLTFWSSTTEKVACSTFVILELDLGFKESVDR